MCNWNLSYVMQWLLNILFLLLAAKSGFQTEFRQNGKHLSSQPTPLPLVTGVKTGFLCGLTSERYSTEIPGPEDCECAGEPYTGCDMPFQKTE